MLDVGGLNFGGTDGRMDGWYPDFMETNDNDRQTDGRTDGGHWPRIVSALVLDSSRSSAAVASGTTTSRVLYTYLGAEMALPTRAYRCSPAEFESEHV